MLHHVSSVSKNLSTNYYKTETGSGTTSSTSINGTSVWLGFINSIHYVANLYKQYSVLLFYTFYYTCTSFLSV